MISAVLLSGLQFTGAAALLSLPFAAAGWGVGALLGLGTNNAHRRAQIFAGAVVFMVAGPVLGLALAPQTAPLWRALAPSAPASLDALTIVGAAQPSPALLSNAAPIESAPVLPANFASIFAAMFGAGALAFFAWRRLRARSGQRRLSAILAAATPADSALQRAAADWAARFGVRVPWRIVVVEAAITPFAVLVRGAARLVAPRAMAQPDFAQSLTLALAHELAHVARDDLRAKSLQVLLADCLAFNPFALGLLQSWEAAREEAADALVLDAAPHARRAYAQSWLQALQLGLVSDPARCAFLPFSRLFRKRRLQLMIDPTAHPPGLARRLARIAGIILAALAVPGLGFGAGAISPLLPPSAAFAASLAADEFNYIEAAAQFAARTAMASAVPGADAPTDQSPQEIAAVKRRLAAIKREKARLAPAAQKYADFARQETAGPPAEVREAMDAALREAHAQKNIALPADPTPGDIGAAFGRTLNWSDGKLETYITDARLKKIYIDYQNRENEYAKYEDTFSRMVEYRVEEIGLLLKYESMNKAKENN